MQRHLYFLLFIILFIGCKKRNPISPNNGNGSLNDSTIVFNDGVYVVDTSKYILNTDTTLLNQGIYEYNSNYSFNNFKVNGIIVGLNHGGYIRKITSINYLQNKIEINTTPGKLDDAIKSGEISFSTTLQNLKGGRTENNGFNYPINNLTIFNNGPVDITINNGNIQLNPNLKGGIKFGFLKIAQIDFSSDSATLNANFDINFNISQPINIVDNTISLGKLSEKILLPPYGIPVLINYDILCKYSATINGSFNQTIKFNTNYNWSLGIHYNNGQWTSEHAITHQNSISFTNSTGQIGVNFQLSLIPEIQTKIIGVFGPYVSLSINSDIIGDISVPSLDWDFAVNGWLTPLIGANASFLGNNIADYSLSWNSDTIGYLTPFSLNKISGDNQSGGLGQLLPESLKVQVLNSFGLPQSNVPVYFLVNNGGGTVNPNKVITDTSGYAQTQWTLGSQTDTQKVEAIVNNGKEEQITGSPVYFSDSSNTNSGTVTDIDGNVYHTVKIGTQIWMVENLKVTHYRNGDPIPNVTDPKQWDSLTTGAFCYYGNDSNVFKIYGGLYNWYAVNDSRGLAPVGWHIPTTAEWQTLSNYLGNTASYELKDSAYWVDFGTPPSAVFGNDSTGFAALPGGLREDYTFNPGFLSNPGFFTDVGYNGYWWTSTEYNLVAAFNVEMLNNYNGELNLNFGQIKYYGLSVRCIKN